MVSDLPKSPVDKILDFIFSFFERDKSQPIPGILQGALPPRPALRCTTRESADLEGVFGRGPYKLLVKALNDQANEVSWKTAVSPSDNREDTYEGGTEGSMVVDLPPSPKLKEKRYSVVTMSDELQGPALYAVEASQSGVRKFSVLLLIVPESQCQRVSRSYQQAVRFTDTWPKETPEDAITYFRSRYLQALAGEPDEAPVDESQR